jgi:hypothetical protein
MLFRSLAAAAALLAVSTPVAAQDLDLRAQVAAFIQPTNAARTGVVVAQLREAVDNLESDLEREVRVLRGLVDTLISRGLITREEFLEHVRARGG